MTIATNPPGAACSVDRKGERLGIVSPTPGSLRLDKSKNDLNVTCTKVGHDSATIAQSSRFVGTTFGNLIVGGGIGFIVDAATGANFVYPSEIKMDLAPSAPAIASVPPDYVPISAGLPSIPAAYRFPDKL